jgi:hypothetical protein
MDEREHMKTTRASQTAASQRVVQQTSKSVQHADQRANEPTNEPTNESIARLYRSNMHRHVVAGRLTGLVRPCVLCISHRTRAKSQLVLDMARRSSPPPLLAQCSDPGSTRTYTSTGPIPVDGNGESQFCAGWNSRGPFYRVSIGAAFPAFRSLPHHLTAGRMMFDHPLLAARDEKVGQFVRSAPQNFSPLRHSLAIQPGP